MRSIPLSLIAFAVLGCSRPLVAGDGGDEESSGAGDSTTTSGTSTSTSIGGTAPTTAPPPATSADSSDGDDGCPFICEPDNGSGSIECSIWEQDCPAGEKCMPWANDGGNSWNGTTCTPLDPNPAEIGDECTVEGSGVSGVDNCGLAAMCWNVDVETLTGSCIAFCIGSEAAPTCEDPLSTCFISGGGELALCFPTCHPLEDDCDENEACTPTYSEGPWACTFATGQSGYGAPCEYAGACTPGLFCATGSAIPGCEASNGCCGQLCDTTMDAAQQCPQFPEEQCLPWYDPGSAPPGLENLGACAIPPP